MLEILKNKKTEVFLFFLFLCAALVLLHIPEYFFVKPQGIHFIRQTDSLSFINYYTKTGFNFFDTGNLNCAFNGNGKAVCEFPIFYYLAALLSLLGIKSYLTMKAFSLIIFCYTAFSVFNFLRTMFSFINALALTFLLFSSTVILFYMMSYIPNFPALCFSLLGLVSFLEYKKNPRNALIYKALVFFLIAGLLKITYAIYAIACAGMLTIDFLKSKKLNIKALTGFGFLFLLLVCWNLYVIHYNQVNGVSYYLTSTDKAFWNVSNDEKIMVLDYIYNNMINHYYFQSTVHVFFVVLLVSLFFFKCFNKTLAQLVVISLLGCVCYFFLFFWQFKYHDYYFMEYVPFLFLAFTNGYYAIVTKLSSRKNISFALSIALLALTFLSLKYANLNLNRRYQDKGQEMTRAAHTIDGMESKLDSMKILDDKKILIIPEYSVNGALYFINRFGYTMQDSSLIKPDTYFYRVSDYIIVADSTYAAPLQQKLNLDKAILNYNGASLFLCKH